MEKKEKEEDIFYKAFRRKRSEENPVFKPPGLTEYQIGGRTRDIRSAILSLNL
jgi:hypothetical protein